MRRLGVVAIVLAGLLSIIQAPGMLETVLSMVRDWEGVGRTNIGLVVLSVLPVLASVAVGAWLISKRQSLASQWFDDDAVGIAVGAPDLLRLALITVGVVLIATSVRSLFGVLAGAIVQLYALSTASGFEAPDRNATLLSQLVPLMYPLVSLALGALLVMRAGELADRLWARPVSTIRSVETDAPGHRERG